ncbi:hypothetical protein BKA66DRAFT_446778 [Pyrenochaeta sp. MPI-SDFR-AT-0127]|nr:hypothetical protein BKA66DRAFT_446778 [Pyrenochaeta sp. MPI-SDFR-AT-0127]
MGKIVGKTDRTRFVVSESSGCLDPSDGTSKFSQTQFGINKFGRPTEEYFETVGDVVREMIRASPTLQRREVLSSRRSWVDSDHESASQASKTSGVKVRTVAIDPYLGRVAHSGDGYERDHMARGETGGKNELAFITALGLLSRYSLAEGKEGTGSHLLHPVLYRWCGSYVDEEE